MKTVVKDRKFDFQIGLSVWCIGAVVLFCIAMLIYSLGWWFPIGSALIVIIVALMYCTGWLYRRIFGVNP